MVKKDFLKSIKTYFWQPKYGYRLLILWLWGEHMENERNLINIEKEFEKVIGYDYIKKELYRICDIMLNEDVYK